MSYKNWPTKRGIGKDSGKWRALVNTDWLALKDEHVPDDQKIDKYRLALQDLIEAAPLWFGLTATDALRISYDLLPYHCTLEYDGLCWKFDFAECGGISYKDDWRAIFDGIFAMLNRIKLDVLAEETK